MNEKGTEEVENEGWEKQQDACEHEEKQWYRLNRVRSHHRDYILCLACGKQFPVEGEK